jgi:hypothetical protein
MTAGRAVLQRDRGATLEGVEGANLWHGRLNEAGRNTREEERERRGSPSPATSFIGGGELGAAALCEGDASSVRVGVLPLQR